MFSLLKNGELVLILLKVSKWEALDRRLDELGGSLKAEGETE